MPRHRINERGDIQLGQGETANAALKAIVEGFLAALRARKQSPQTVKKRRDTLRKLLLYLEARHIERFADVDGPMLEAFRLCLVDHGYSENEIEHTQRATQFLFRHLEEQNLIFDNPAERLKIRKATVTLGKVLTEREANRLLAAPDVTRPKGLRDRAILEVLYATGMRRGEAAGLAVHDVDLEHATVKVQGKGSKQRLIPLGKHAVHYLRLYLQEARPRLLPKLSPPTDALWVDHFRKRLSLQGVCGVVKRYAAEAGVPADPHTMRRTCATQLLRGGAHPAVVARILGHADMTSLSHYLRTTITDLKETHARTNPGR